MCTKLIIALLLVSSIAASDYFLSPQFPPTAFIEQHYEVRFRVRGMPYPTFTFTNLPDFFSGTETGIVSGTPTLTGTFKFGVSFTNG